MECTVIYYKDTPADLLINHKNHYKTKVNRVGDVSAQCKQCNKTLTGKNAVAHMKDHVATHTGE